MHQTPEIVSSVLSCASVSNPEQARCNHPISDIRYPTITSTTEASLELELDGQSDLGKPRVPRDLRSAPNLPVHLIASVGTRIELPLGFFHLHGSAQ